MGGYEDLEEYMPTLDGEINDALCSECSHDCDEDDEECPALEIAQEISDQICAQAVVLMKEILKEWAGSEPSGLRIP